MFRDPLRVLTQSAPLADKLSAPHSVALLHKCANGSVAVGHYAVRFVQCAPATNPTLAPLHQSLCFFCGNCHRSNPTINRSALSAVGFVLGQRAPGYFSVRHYIVCSRLADAPSHTRGTPLQSIRLRSNQASRHTPTLVRSLSSPRLGSQLAASLLHRCISCNGKGHLHGRSIRVPCLTFPPCLTRHSSGVPKAAPAQFEALGTITSSSAMR